MKHKCLTLLFILSLMTPSAARSGEEIFLINPDWPNALTPYKMAFFLVSFGALSYYNAKYDHLKIENNAPSLVAKYGTKEANKRKRNIFYALVLLSTALIIADPLTGE